MAYITLDTLYTVFLYNVTVIDDLLSVDSRKAQFYAQCSLNAKVAVRLPAVFEYCLDSWA